jgi:thioredoxin-related protein
MRFIQLALLISIFLTACRQNETTKPYKTGMEGKPLPEFAIQLLDSVSYLHSKDIPDGKKLIVFYYSPTCPYCRAQMRDMKNNIEKFKDEQLYILTDADLSSIKKFVSYFDLQNYKNVTIGRDTGGVIQQNYGLESVPFTAFFDKNKKLKVAYSGRTNSNLLLQIR